MMDFSKTLQEDIRNNQINLKLAIQNHQALVLKLRGNLTVGSSVIKLKLADIQKHIISLGEAQKDLLARAKKEIAANSTWNNNISLDNSDGLDSKPVSNLQSSEILESRKPQTTVPLRQYSRSVKTEVSLPDDKEKISRKNERTDDIENNELSPPSKRIKAMLHASPRQSSPVLSEPRDYIQPDLLASSSDDSQESLPNEKESEPSKVLFLAAVGLITREEFNAVQSKHTIRRRRRLAGQHSQYTSHWDLTVRRHRPRLEQDKERPPPECENDNREESPATSPPIIEVKKERESSSASRSPSPTFDGKDCIESPSSSEKNFCVICRKRGILSECDICSTLYHWVCLDKSKVCPQCQASQAGDTVSPFRSATEASVSKVLGDISKPPTVVSSMEVIARYYKRNTSESASSSTSNTLAEVRTPLTASMENGKIVPSSATDDTEQLQAPKQVDEQVDVPKVTKQYPVKKERLKSKKILEARKAALKLDLASLEKKAAELSASLVTQTANIKTLTAGEEKIRGQIKNVIDFITFMKTESTPS